MTKSSQPPSQPPSRPTLSSVMGDLKKDYVAKAPERLEKIRLFTQTQNWEALSTEYHNLKGTGKTYGLPEISILCEKLENIFLPSPANEKIFPHLHILQNAPHLLQKIFLHHQQPHHSPQNVQQFDLSQEPLALQILSLSSPAPKSVQK